ncbi:roadblock/LC7 domain-containing protein [Streptomyces sp. NRRL S-1868]
MNAPTMRTSSSSEARNLRWLLDSLVDEVPAVRSVVVVSSDGLLLLSSDPGLGTEHGEESGDRVSRLPRTPDGRPLGAGAGNAPWEPPRQTPSRRPGAARSGGAQGTIEDLAAIVSGVASLTVGAARLLDTGAVKQTMVAMNEGALLVMTIGDGSLLGVHAAPDADMSVVGYHMALFVGRAGHVLTPELRTELRKSMEEEQQQAEEQELAQEPGREPGQGR